MLLNLDITSITGCVSTGTPGRYTTKVGLLSHVICSVHPSEGDHLDLETGEIFQDPQYAKAYGQQDKAISGNLYIREGKGGSGQGDETEDDSNRMTYLPGYPEIYFQYTLPRNEFAALRDHILAGHLPNNVSIECDQEALSSGSLPDEIKWSNLTNGYVRISQIYFYFVYSENKSEDDKKYDFLSEPVGRKDYADSARVARAITGRLIAIERLVKWALVLGVVCVALLVIISHSLVLLKSVP
jgi:hypothetical protein